MRICGLRQWRRAQERLKMNDQPIITDEYGKAAGEALKALEYNKAAEIKKIIGDVMEAAACLKNLQMRRVLGALLIISGDILVKK